MTNASLFVIFTYGDHEDMKKILSLVIPCYNEEETIKLFIKETQKYESQLSEQLDFEYIFVNDGSNDNTLKVLKKISVVKNIHYISFSRNFGKESALLAGLRFSSGDFIVVMDADLQDPPKILGNMYKKIKEGYDVVGTRRINREGEPRFRSFCANLFYKIMSQISETPIVNGARDYRMMTRQVVDSVLDVQEVNRFSKGIFSWVGYDTYYIDFENQERVAGKTSWNFWSLFKYSIEGFINFSEALLNIATYSGMLAFLISFVGMIFVFIRKIIFGDQVDGWTSMVIIILFIGAIQLFCIGILGKYISKIFLETKKRPSYFIKESDFNAKEYTQK